MTDDFAAYVDQAVGAQTRARERLLAQPQESALQVLSGALEGFHVPAGVVVPTEPLGHPCASCSEMAAKQERAVKDRGHLGLVQLPRIPIAQAERFVGWAGHVYWAANCSSCTDLEFSKRFNLRREKAQREGNIIELGKLDHELQAWRARGRRFLG